MWGGEDLFRFLWMGRGSVLEGGSLPCYSIGGETEYSYGNTQCLFFLKHRVFFSWFGPTATYYVTYLIYKNNSL